MDKPVAMTLARLRNFLREINLDRLSLKTDTRVPRLYPSLSTPYLTSIQFNPVH